MFSVRSPAKIYLSACILSVFLFTLISSQVSVINPDAICYLQSAKLMSVSVSQAMHLCDQAKWPFYSFLIYHVAALTHFSYETAAYFLNGIFSLISVLTFIAIVDLLAMSSSSRATPAAFGGSRVAILLFAAITILFAHVFNGVKEYIIRDHGFWAFYLLSIFFLLRASRSLVPMPGSRGQAAGRRCASAAQDDKDSTSSLHATRCPADYTLDHPQRRPALYARDPGLNLNCLLWNLTLILATLFRIEGAIFLICMPFVILCCNNLPWQKRFSLFLQCHLPTMVIGLALLAWILIHPNQSLSRLSEFNNQFQNGLATLLNNYHNKKDQFAQLILSNNGARDAGVVLVISFIVWYVINIISNLSLIVTGLVLYAFKKQFLKMNSSSQMVLLGYLLVNIGITSIFLAENLFLSKRYLVALSLVLMFFVPFALYDIWSNRSRWVFNLILALILFSSFGVFFHYGDSKQYIREAATWIDKNISKDSLIYSNDLQVSYYSEHLRNTLYSKNTSDHSDYLIIRQSDKKNNISLNSYSPIQKFTSRKGDEIVIYRRQV